MTLVVLVLLVGCATGPSRAPLREPMESRRATAALAPTQAPGGGGGFPERTEDAFLVLQRASGLEPAAWHPAGSALSPAPARELLRQLLQTPVTWRNQAPRQALSWLLREVLAGAERVEYADLRWRAQRFDSLVLPRPDGYLETCLTGTPLQRLGSLQLRDGAWSVGPLRVGDFYFSQAGVLYPVTEALRRAHGPPLAELGLERDAASSALDGVQDAMAQMVVALGRSILHPIRCAEDLTQLPTTLARLIASSPDYFAHYGALSREEQIHEAARLATHLVMMLGGAGAGATGTVGEMGGLGAQLPLLSLSARGELVSGPLASTVTVPGSFSSSRVTSSRRTSIRGSAAIMAATRVDEHRFR